MSVPVGAVSVDVYSAAVIEHRSREWLTSKMHLRLLSVPVYKYR